MSLIYTKKYSDKPKIREIKIENYPVVLFGDSHCNLRNIKRLQELYSRNLIVSLGDSTFFQGKKEDYWNAHSIQYFIDNNIPTLLGNHDSVVMDDNEYNITHKQREFLKGSPMGFKLILPDGTYYSCWHNECSDLWGFKTDENLSQEDFFNIFSIDKQCAGVIKSHFHRHFIVDYPEISCKMYSIGRLSVDGDYCLIDKDSVKLKRL